MRLPIFRSALLLAGAACSGEAPPPWETTSAEPGARLRVDPPMAPTPTPSTSTSASARPARARPPGAPPACDEGLRASGEPRHDVTRLGLVCGPTEGFRRDLDAIEGALAEGGAAVEVPLPLEPGRCYRIVAAAETTISDLDVELRSERDVPLASDDDDEPLVVVHRDGAPCAGSGGEARAIFRAGKGRGRFAAEVWSRPSGDASAAPAGAGSIDGPRGED